MLMMLMWSRCSLLSALKVNEATQVREASSSDVHDVVSGLPRIAVMISGITLEDGMRIPSGNVVDHMSEEEYEPNERERIVSTPGPRPWDSFKEHVLGPLKRDFRGNVDVFVCTNEVAGHVPEEVTAAFTITLTTHSQRVSGTSNSTVGFSHEQFDRTKACFSKVSTYRKDYTYFMKVRPDFIFRTSIEDYSALRRDCMHTRFQRMWNIAGVRACHSQLISGRCPTCNGQRGLWKGLKFGWIVDDMVFVVPSELAKSTFMSSEELEQWSRHEFPNAEHMSHWVNKHALTGPTATTEGLYTSALFMNKVPACPLCINGWPKASHRDWSEHQHQCPNANSNYPCGAQQGSVDEWVEYVKTGKLPGIIQAKINTDSKH